jgi:hypothetical protein
MRPLIRMTLLLLFLAARAMAAKPCDEAKEFAGRLAQLSGHEARLRSGSKWDPIAELSKAKKGKGNKFQPFKCGSHKFIPDSAFKGIYWVKDTAGHAGCAWKVYKSVGNNQYQVSLCADENGKLLDKKHESNAGKSIQCK